MDGRGKGRWTNATLTLSRNPMLGLSVHMVADARWMLGPRKAKTNDTTSAFSHTADNIVDVTDM